MQHQSAKNKSSSHPLIRHAECSTDSQSIIGRGSGGCRRTQGDSRGHGPPVDPEGNPGQHDHQGGREVGLQQEEEDVAPQGEVDVEAVVPAWGQRAKVNSMEEGGAKSWKQMLRWCLVLFFCLLLFSVVIWCLCCCLPLVL